MKKVFFRIFAFILDSIILGIVLASIITFVPVFHNKEITNLNNESLSLINECSDAIKKIDDVLNDSKIDEDELNTIKEDYPSVSYIFEDYSKKEEIKSDELSKSIQDYMISKSKTIEYKLDRLNLNKYLLELVLTLMYFGVIQYILKGQTLGKKVFRLYVVDEEGNLPSIYSFLLRSLLTSTILVSILTSILAYNLSESSFIGVYKYLSGFSSFYVVLVFAFVLFRNDQKGLHDLILHTHIKLLNKDNTEYVEAVFKEENEESSN